MKERPDTDDDLLRDVLPQDVVQRDDDLARNPDAQQHIVVSRHTLPRIVVSQNDEPPGAKSSAADKSHARPRPHIIIQGDSQPGNDSKGKENPRDDRWKDQKDDDRRRRGPSPDDDPAPDDRLRRRDTIPSIVVTSDEEDLPPRREGPRSHEILSNVAVKRDSRQPYTDLPRGGDALPPIGAVRRRHSLDYDDRFGYGYGGRYSDVLRRDDAVFRELPRYRDVVLRDDLARRRDGVFYDNFAGRRDVTSYSSLPHRRDVVLYDLPRRRSDSSYDIPRRRGYVLQDFPNERDILVYDDSFRRSSGVLYDDLTGRRNGVLRDELSRRPDAWPQDKGQRYSDAPKKSDASPSVHVPRDVLLRNAIPRDILLRNVLPSDSVPKNGSRDILLRDVVPRDIILRDVLPRDILLPKAVSQDDQSRTMKARGALR
ncbi:hypothetical protein C7M84_016444 [Penaeus vannamei]|uniref:Uncharacterized protein n=1 Tax=Penaeus vannamei TaxID=6689 RepID=A0A3R7M2M4_PENVA|nr:hypothetical protein C7M84_016444 [Penaeus vannamei]